MLSVNENTTGNLPEEEKDLIRWCFEATFINKNFANQVTKGEEKVWKSDKVDLEDLIEKKLYKYRKWTLDGKYGVVVRSEIDSFTKVTNEAGNEVTQFLKICAMNEPDLGTDWRTKLETSRGSLESTEFRNNSCKLSKWLCQANLADVEVIKMGYVSRLTQKDDKKHTVLLVEQIKASNLSGMIGYKLRENWSIVKHLTETLLKQEDGNYALVKLPYKQEIRIYRIPKEEEEKA